MLQSPALLSPYYSEHNDSSIVSTTETSQKLEKLNKQDNIDGRYPYGL